MTTMKKNEAFLGDLPEDWKQSLEVFVSAIVQAGRPALQSQDELKGEIRKISQEA